MGPSHLDDPIKKFHVGNHRLWGPKTIVLCTNGGKKKEKRK